MRMWRNGAPALAACALLWASCSEPVMRPDIVMIVVDTLRADMVCIDGKRAESPAFDRLAEDGVVFTKAFSHAPMTLPSHTSLFASRPPFETKVLNNGDDVPGDLPLFSEWLGQHGYDTFATISLGTLTPSKPDAGLDRGFDVYDADYWHIDTAPDALDRLRRVLNKIDTRTPFFLFAHFSDPHEPYNLRNGETTTAEVLVDGEVVETITTSPMTQWEVDLPMTKGKHTLEVRADHDFIVKSFEWKKDDKFAGPKWQEGKQHKAGSRILLEAEFGKDVTSHIRMWLAAKPDPKRIPDLYAGEVEFLDGYVGEFLRELDRRGFYKSSIIALTSDHGEALGEHKIAAGHVQNLYDEMLHVPLVLKMPEGYDKEHEKLASLAGKMVPHQDIVPTLLHLAGVPELPGQRGRSLFYGEPTELVAETHKPEAKRDLVGIRNDAYKLVYEKGLSPDKDRFELYDLAADPEELQNLYGTATPPADWVEQVRTMAEISLSENDDGSARSSELQDKLDAMGYGGGDEDAP